MYFQRHKYITELHIDIKNDEVRVILQKWIIS